MLIAPFTVEHYECSAQLRVKLGQQLLEKRSAKQIISAGIAACTTDERLTNLVGELKSLYPTEESWLQRQTPQELRDVIRVGTQFGQKPNSILIHVTMIGRGRPDERAFLNMLVSTITTELIASSKESNQEQLAQAWVASLAQEISEQNQTLLQATDLLSEQLDRTLLQTETLAETIKGRLNSQEEVGDGDDEITSISLQHEIARVYQQMNAAQAANNWHADHPEMLSMRQRIQTLRDQLNSFYGQNGALRVQNQFANASMSNERVGDNLAATILAPLIDPKRDFANLYASAGILSSMQSNIRQNQKQMEQMFREFQIQLNQPGLTSEDAVGLEKMVMSKRSKPIQGPQGRSWMLAVCLAVSLGGVLALRYNPTCDKRRFKSQDQVATALAMPVVGSIREFHAAKRSKHFSDSLTKTILHASELVLLGVCCLLVIATLVDTDFFGEVVTNPFAAISNVMWTLLSK